MAKVTPTTTTAPAAGSKEAVESKPNVQLIKLLTAYDENVEAAEQSFISVIEWVQSEQLSKEVIIASFMKARNCSFETATRHYGTMKKMLSDETVLQDLKDGKITMKVARERTTTKQANPASSKPEAKEARFNNTLKAFSGAAKESGFTLKEILATVEAELKSAGIK